MDEIMPGARVKVFDNRIYIDDKTTPLSFTMRDATVVCRYGERVRDWIYEDLVDVVFDHRPNEVSKGHFTWGIEVLKGECPMKLQYSWEGSFRIVADDGTTGEWASYTSVATLTHNGKAYVAESEYGFFPKGEQVYELTAIPTSLDNSMEYIDMRGNDHRVEYEETMKSQANDEDFHPTQEQLDEAREFTK
jgi:hypothetical protein